MKRSAIAAVFLATCGVVFAGLAPGPVNNPPVYPVVIVPPDDTVGGVSENPTPTPVILTDADRDGYIVSIDCNDANPAASPIAVEQWNGIDDNCDGVVDDGFDTTIDFPRVALSTAVWPQPGLMPINEFVATNAQPRLVWAGDRFLAVWTDVRNRLFVARIGLDGTLLGTPEFVARRVRGADAVWTGTRLGIVYETYFTTTPSVRLMMLDRDGVIQDDFGVAAVGREPKVAWGQDRFGVVWKTLGGDNALRFQRFSASGEPLSSEEILERSAGRPAIAFSGTSVRQLEGGVFVVREGTFGIAYEAHHRLVASGDVLLSARPREVGRGPSIGPIRVNQHDDPYTDLGAMPAIAANASGFAVGWHAIEDGLDRAQARVFSLDGLAPVQEFTPDLDAARYGRVIWTGGEFVMANDNQTGGGAGATSCANASDVHFRRVDASGNTHLSTVNGPWTELNLRDSVHGSVSAHPDVAIAGEVLGVVWVEGDPALDGRVGKLWFAIIEHK
jgi:hypothetical protein